MPQSPASNRPVQTRVSSGVPWWLWAILIVIGGGVGYSLVLKSIPEDPDTLFADAMAAASRGEGPVVHKNLELLKEFPGRESQVKLLEGIAMIGRSRPLKAIPLLKEAAEDPELRIKALTLLGGAYASATDRKTSLATFEMLLEEDENAHDIRLSIARILNDNLAWEEALQHINTLIEKGYELPMVLQLRADIRAELGEFAEAAADYQKSIDADPADPTNGVKATRLMRCLSEIGDYKKMAEYLEGVDAMNIRESARAETLLAKGDLRGAMSALDPIRMENPSDAAMNRVYAQIMLKHELPEKAAEAVATLRPVLATATRDVKLHRTFAELALAAGNPELASLAQQNVDQLVAMEKDFSAKLAEVIRNRDDVEGRLELAEIARDLARFEFARKLFDGLINFHPERESEFMTKMLSMATGIPQLVSTGGEDVSKSSDGEPSTSTDLLQPPPQAAPSDNPEATNPVTTDPATPNAETSAPADPQDTDSETPGSTPESAASGQ